MALGYRRRAHRSPAASVQPNRPTIRPFRRPVAPGRRHVRDRAPAGRAGQPVLLAVDGDATARRDLAGALRRRFGADYHVLASGSAEAGLALLGRLGREGAEVAMVIADFRLAGMGGIEFLTRAHRLHPGAKRALLTTVEDGRSAAPVHRAMALSQLDLRLVKPWVSPEEWLYPQVGQALAAWWRSHRPRFERVHVIGEQWALRSHELRDLCSRNTIPFKFYRVDSDAGRRLLAERGLDAARLPVVILSSGRVLIEPTNAEIAEALGVSTRPEAETYDLAIIGAGPAGLAAAVSAASEGLRTVVVEPQAIGGQAGTSSMIRNYLGFPGGISGG